MDKKLILQMNIKHQLSLITWMIQLIKLNEIYHTNVWILQMKKIFLCSYMVHHYLCQIPKFCFFHVHVDGEGKGV
jgi:hypothetical protein